MDMTLMLKEARQSAAVVPESAMLDLDVELQNMFSKTAAGEEAAAAADAAKTQAPVDPLLPAGYDTKEQADAAAQGKAGEWNDNGGMLNRYSGSAAGFFGILGALFGGAVGGVKGAAGFGILGGILGLLAQKMGFLPDSFSKLIDKYAGDPVKAAQLKDSISKKVPTNPQDPAYQKAMQQHQQASGIAPAGAPAAQAGAATAAGNAKVQADMAAGAAPQTAPTTPPVPVDASQKGQHNIPGIPADTVTAANPADSPSAKAMSQPNPTPPAAQPPAAAPAGNVISGPAQGGVPGSPAVNALAQQTQAYQAQQVPGPTKAKEDMEHERAMAKAKIEAEKARKDTIEAQKGLAVVKNQPPPPEPAPVVQPAAGLPPGGLFSGQPQNGVPGNPQVNAFQQQLNGAKQALPGIPNQPIGDGGAAMANKATTQTPGTPVQGAGGTGTNKTNGTQNPTQPVVPGQPPVPLAANILKKPIPGAK